MMDCRNHHGPFSNWWALVSHLNISCRSARQSQVVEPVDGEL